MYEKQLGRAIYPHIGGHSQKTLRRTLFIFDLRRSEKICLFLLCIYRNIWRRNKYDQIPTDRLICSLENITQPWFAAIKVFFFIFFYPSCKCAYKKKKSFFRLRLQLWLQKKKYAIFTFCAHKSVVQWYYLFLSAPKAPKAVDRIYFPVNRSSTPVFSTEKERNENWWIFIRILVYNLIIPKMTKIYRWSVRH